VGTVVPHVNVRIMVQVSMAISNLEQRLGQEASRRELNPKEKLVLRLHQQYPSDVGVLSAFFLNLIVLRTGQVPPKPDYPPYSPLKHGVCNT